MIKLKSLSNKIIFENDENDINKILDYLKGAYQFEKLIYRGAKQQASNVGIKQIRTDRTLLSTTNFQNAILNTIIKQENLPIHIPDRRMCLFASTSIHTALRFGNNMYVIFPKLSCKILYNDDVKDSYNVYGGLFRGDREMLNDINVLKILQQFNCTEIISLLDLLKIHGDSIYDNVQKINIKKLLDEFDIIIEYDHTYYTGVENSKFIYLVKNYKEYILKMIGYLRGIQLVNNNIEIINDNVELMIYGDEYLYIDVDYFIDNFIWSDDKNQWIYAGNK